MSGCVHSDTVYSENVCYSSGFGGIEQLSYTEIRKKCQMVLLVTKYRYTSGFVIERLVALESQNMFSVTWCSYT